MADFHYEEKRAHSVKAPEALGEKAEVSV